MDDNTALYVQNFVAHGSKSRRTCAFVERIGATVLGVKPACLTTVSPECLVMCGRHLSGSGPVTFAIVKSVKEKKQLFIYHRERLEATLASAPVRRYLEDLGYPQEGGTTQLVRILTERLRGTRFPHEIGIFLGYPLKDVRGFMGAKIPYRKTMGWRMYGDVHQSEEIYWQHADARKSVRNMLLQVCQ